jgi:hypothetical protein
MRSPLTVDGSSQKIKVCWRPVFQVDDISRKFADAFEELFFKNRPSAILVIAERTKNDFLGLTHDGG